MWCILPIPSAPHCLCQALRRLSVGPHEAVFVDDLGVNLKGARAVGLHTVKVNNGTATEYLEAIPTIEAMTTGSSRL